MNVLESLHAAIGQRRYDETLAGLRHTLAQQPQALSAQDWHQFFNGFDWFEREHEAEEYFNYATSLITSVADTVDGLADKDAAFNLANTFINSVQFRQTAHSNGDPRSMMRARARLFAVALSRFPLPRTHTFANPPNAKPRLGILFKHLVQDPETTSVLPFFQEVRAHGIEVVLFVASDRVDQNFLNYVTPRCDKILRLSDNLGQAILQIRASEIDLLLFGNDITAKPSPFSYLSFFRLARASACCVSSLVTTASPAIDVYFGCDYYQRAGFDKHFDERFVSVPNPGFAFSFPAPQSEDANQITRERLGLAAETPLLVSGANQSKLHKGMIAVWARILQRCPSAHLLLYPFPPHFGGTRQDVTNRVLTHFKEFGIAAGRVIIANSIPTRGAVIGMLRIADLGLDSFPYTGVTTVVDAIEAGLPTVSLKGQALRSSQGAAVLHTAGFDDLVVNSLTDYVDLAVTLVEDSARRTALRARLATVSRAVPAFLRPAVFSVNTANVYHALHADLVRDGGIMRAAGEAS